MTFTVPANVAQAADDGQGNVKSKFLALVTASGELEINDAPAGGKEIPPPDETLLLPNYPNPSNPETWIPYQLAVPSEVTLAVYSAKGEVVRTLALGQTVGGRVSDSEPRRVLGWYERVW